jgi:hypothetical protein
LLLATAALATAQSPFASTIFFDVTEGADIPNPNNLDLQTSDVVQKACGARIADVDKDDQPGPPWLSLGSTATCTTPVRIKVLVDPAGLKPGQYLAGIMANIGTSVFKLKVVLMIYSVPPNLIVPPAFLFSRAWQARPIQVNCHYWS